MPSMNSTQIKFLPGVCEETVRAALDRAGGKEIQSGKLSSPESSAALAVNAFGWFVRSPEQLPPFPGLEDLNWPARKVEVERQMRFPWRGGRHPWLDAAVTTDKHLIGIESKRFEPFRDAKACRLSAAYDRDVWGYDMVGYCRMRDALRNGSSAFIHLDAAQLVKHAFGLVTEGRRSGRHPILLYLFAEPESRGNAGIPKQVHDRHRAEIARFSEAVQRSEVRFASCSYREWLSRWNGATAAPADAIISTFNP